MLAERQKHGFIYERFILNENGLLGNKIYNGKWDGWLLLNNNKLPLSIKCIQKKSSIELGDLKRQINVNCDFILHIGFWEKNTENIVETYKILVKYENWKRYFGDINILNDMLVEMKTISNDYCDDKKWADFRKKYNKLYGKSVIGLRFKRDHKKQKRIQCGISNKNFYNIVLKENKILV